MIEKILLVDDEPNVLAGFARQLRESHTVETAPGGAEALDALDTRGPFAVVVSDMRMPGMDGAAFLARARDRYPDTVRILLTGYADIQSAIEAINRGGIFRFLTKPCPPHILTGALDDALAHYRLVTAERELVDMALRDSVPVVGEGLALANPSAFALGGIRPLLPEFRPEFVQQFPAGGCRLGGYELLEPLGRGTMGVVFKAFEPSLNRELAIKIVAPDLVQSTRVRQRFAREVRAAAAIRHENVVAVYAVGESAGVPYLAMEYVAGDCLEAHLIQHGALPIPRVVGIGRQIAAALVAAHARRIVHRDLKPANVLLEAGTGVVKLTDFGLARALDEVGMTANGALVGTAHFMAPEVIEGQPVAPASDLFALGAVLYEMATGRVAFPGNTVASVLHAICASEPEPPIRLRPDLPEWLIEIILWLLDKAPARRPTAAQTLDALSASLELAS